MFITVVLDEGSLSSKKMLGLSKVDRIMFIGENMGLKSLWYCFQYYPALKGGAINFLNSDYTLLR